MKLYKWNMSRFWRRLKPRRKYKDKLFQRIFSDKKDLLDLYNAVNQTSYANPDDLEITTLEDVLSDILAKSQNEVFNMLLTEYDEKLHLKTVYNEGHEDGTNEAIQKTISMLRKLNIPEDTMFQLISEEYNISVEEIKNIINQ